MKINFKKISAVATSVILTGMTLGVAAAANYPAPFVQGSTANVAIVYGASSQDMVPAQSISDALASKLPSGASAGPAGESYALEKVSTKWNLGNGVLDVVSSTVSDTHLPTLLADGTYEDDDNDEFDYEQKVNLYNFTYTMFEDSDYKEDVPSLGVKIASNSRVLNYTFEFQEEPYQVDMETTDLPILGREYYVLDVTNSSSAPKLTLLDSAQKVTLSEGESTTLTVGGKTYDVAVTFIGETEVKFNINGDTTNALAEGETQKLASNAYVGVRDILYTGKDSGVSKVEFSIGQGKLVLNDGDNVELNEEDVEELTVDLVPTADGKMTRITLIWTADDDLFVTEDSAITLPGFGSLKLSSTGIEFPEEESFEIANSGADVVRLEKFPFEDGTSDVNLLKSNASGTGFAYIGEDVTDSKLRTSNTTTLMFNVTSDDYFVASWTDGRDSESYLLDFTAISSDNGVNRTSLKSVASNWEKTELKTGDTVEIGNVDLTITRVTDSNDTVLVTAGNSQVNFDRVYTKEGLRMFLPFDCNADACSYLGNNPGAINLSA